MKHALAILAVLPLACASASAAPDTPPHPAPGAGGAGGDSCKPTGKAVFEIDHRAVPGAKIATSTVKMFGNGAWTKDETDGDGKAAPQTAGCYGKATAKQVSDALHAAPWKITTAHVHCMAMSSSYTEYQVDGKLVFTQKLCSGQSLDDKSKAALDAAIAEVEPIAKPAP